MNRMINFYSLTLHPTNWRPLILVALLVAQKVWDDRYLCTADFATIYPFFSKDELVQLELKFLELIEYNVQIKGSTYAKYYFELRSLFKDEVSLSPKLPSTNPLSRKSFHLPQWTLKTPPSSKKSPITLARRQRKTPSALLIRSLKSRKAGLLFLEVSLNLIHLKIPKICYLFW